MSSIITGSSETSSSALTHSLGITVAAAVLAWFAISPRCRRARQVIRRMPLFSSSIDALRSLHSGIVGDYVMWIVIGVVVLGAIFMQFG